MRTFLIFIALLITTPALTWAKHSDPSYNNPPPAYYVNEDLLHAAKRLAKASKRLYHRLDRETGHGPLAHQAQDLAKAARQFRREVRRGSRPRALKRRYRVLADCLYQIKEQFHYREYGYLSHRAQRRLERTLYALDEVRDGVHATLRQYSHHRPRHQRHSHRRGYFRP